MRHSPTCSRNALFTFSASSRATGTCCSVPIRRHAISSIEHTFFDRQAGVDRLQNQLVILGIEPMIGVHGDHGRAQLPRIAH
jgi:hypothetical protein